MSTFTGQPMPPLRFMSAVILGMITAGCGFTAPAGEPRAAAAAKPTLSFDNIILTEADAQGQGQLWELKAKRAEYSRDGKEAIVTGIEGAFFEKGKKALLIKATQGKIQTEARIISLTGAVKAQSIQFETNFTANEVRWLPDKNLIEANGKVVFNQPKRGITVTGAKLTGDLAGSTVLMTGGVVAQAPEQSIILKATQAEWNVAQEQVRVQNVTAESPKAQVQAPQMTWNLTTQVVQADQGITYQRSSPVQTLTAQSAQWDPGQQSLQVLGNVDYRQGGMRVRGDRATADLKAGTVQVQGQVTTSLEGVALR